MYPKTENVPIAQILIEEYGEDLQENIPPVVLIDLWTSVRCLSLKMPLSDITFPRILRPVLEELEGCNFADLTMLFYWMEERIMNREDITQEMLDDLG